MFKSPENNCSNMQEHQCLLELFPIGWLRQIKVFKYLFITHHVQADKKRSNIK